MPAKISLIGKRFGKLKIASEAKPFLETDNLRRAVIAECDCGVVKRIRAKDITSGKTRSCGCGVIKSTVQRSFKHGHSSRKLHSPTYVSWKGMIQRCLNPNNPGYYNYGGRGLTVCKRWLDYQGFLEDMGEKPPGLTIERKDNNGNYEVGNCRWATRAEQTRNTRSNRMFTINGFTGCISELARLFGHPPKRVVDRLREGWSPEKAFLTPITFHR